MKLGGIAGWKRVLEFKMENKLEKCSGKLTQDLTGTNTTNYM